LKAQYTEKEVKQMPQFVWTDRMSVGVKLLDNDHKKLVLLINDLHDGLMTGRSRPALDRVVEKLVKFTRIHFAHEEQIFAETGYPGAAAHKQEHDYMIEQIKHLQACFKSDAPIALYLEGIELLKNWLFSHLHGSDQEYGPYLAAKGVNSILTAWEKPLGAVRERQTTGPGMLHGSWPE
jgi:hemerythrin